MEKKWKLYVKAVEDYWIKRAKAQGYRYTKQPNGVWYCPEEINFFMGAMVIYFFDKKNDQLPGSWVFRPLGGASVIEEERLKKEGLIPLKLKEC